METVSTLAALAVTLAGAVGLFRLAPRTPDAARPSGRAVAALLGLAWLLWCARLAPTTAFFVVLTLTMVTLMAAPTAIALRDLARGRSP